MSDAHVRAIQAVLATLPPHLDEHRAPLEADLVRYARLLDPDAITDLSNLVLLCGRHHRVIHEEDWTITMDGGFPLFPPPPWVPGGPRRNPVATSLLAVRASTVTHRDGRPVGTSRRSRWSGRG